MPELMIPEGELQALLSLLQTEREASLATLLAQISSFPEEILLRLMSDAPPGSVAQNHLNLVLAERDLPTVELRLRRWLAHGTDLEEGILLVARTGYPHVDAEHVRSQLDAISKEAASGLPSEREEIIQHLAAVLRNHGIRGADEDYYNPDHSYINRVLERGPGLPITLSIIWILIGRRLGLPIVGVGLPGHFIAGLSSPGNSLFFDPYHDGALRSVRDIWDTVHAAGSVFHPNHLRPSTPLQIVQRSFANLLQAYQMREDVERVRLCQKYLAAF
jgi:regulator of sirC expression with transglutaminase-like and TPR domain